MPPPKLTVHAGTVLGSSTAEQHLRVGGNREVWKASATESDRVAAGKVLSKGQFSAYTRFSNEISVVNENPSNGIVPIIDKYFPVDHHAELT